MPATAPNHSSHSQSSKQSRAIKASTQQQAEIEEIDAAIGRLSRQMNACNYQLMIMIREFDERGGWLKWGFTDAVSGLRWRCDLSANAARDKLRVAHALKKLPHMSKSFESGQLAYSKVRSLTRTATAQNEAELIEQATELTANNVEGLCRQRLNTKKAANNGANRFHAKRSLRLWQSAQTNMMTVAIELTIEEGKLFKKAIEKAAALLSAETSNAADAIQEDGSWHALIETVRRFCCDGSIIPIVENTKG